MDAELNMRGPYSDVEAALIPAAELAAYYDRRFSSFEEEGAEYVEKVGVRRLALRAHHEDLREVEVLRKKVGRLQRRLAEVEVQSAKERVRALRLDSEHKDLHMSQREHKDEIRRLLATRNSPSSPPAAPGQPTGPLPAGASRCLMRLIETPGASGEDIEDPAELWLKIHNDVLGLTDGLAVFESARAVRAQKHTEETELLEAQLTAELAGLEGERERLADALLAFAKLRSQHLDLQRTHAAEMEVLKSCNVELVCRAEELASKGRQKVAEVESVCKQEATEHIEYRRVADVLERQRITVGKGCLQDVRKAGEARVAALENETRVLKERCANSRRRQKLSLEGLRADLSLVNKKLSVLEEVAEQVSTNLGDACSTSASLPKALAQLRAAGVEAFCSPRSTQLAGGLDHCDPDRRPTSSATAGECISVSICCACPAWRSEMWRCCAGCVETQQWCGRGRW